MLRERLNERISQLRDRRRKTRQRLEDIFDRETFTSVAVMGSMGKLMEVSVVPFLDPAAAVLWGRVGAWVVVFVAAVAGAVYWEYLSRAAAAAADAAEEATDSDS